MHLQGPSQRPNTTAPTADRSRGRSDNVAERAVDIEEASSPFKVGDPRADFDPLNDEDARVVAEHLSAYQNCLGGLDRRLPNEEFRRFLMKNTAWTIAPFEGDSMRAEVFDEAGEVVGTVPSEQHEEMRMLSRIIMYQGHMALTFLDAVEGVAVPWQGPDVRPAALTVDDDPWFAIFTYKVMVSRLCRIRTAALEYKGHFNPFLQMFAATLLWFGGNLSLEGEESIQETFNLDIHGTYSLCKISSLLTHILGYDWLEWTGKSMIRQRVYGLEIIEAYRTADTRDDHAAAARMQLEDEVDAGIQAAMSESRERLRALVSDSSFDVRHTKRQSTDGEDRACRGGHTCSRSCSCVPEGMFFQQCTGALHTDTR